MTCLIQSTFQQQKEGVFLLKDILTNSFTIIHMNSPLRLGKLRIVRVELKDRELKKCLYVSKDIEAIQKISIFACYLI